MASASAMKSHWQASGVSFFQRTGTSARGRSLTAPIVKAARTVSSPEEVHSASPFPLFKKQSRPRIFQYEGKRLLGRFETFSSPDSRCGFKLIICLFHNTLIFIPDSGLIIQRLCYTDRRFWRLPLVSVEEERTERAPGIQVKHRLHFKGQQWSIYG